jgi:hypothetical protein
MIKPDEQIIRAILNLDNNISWNEIVKWISESLFSVSLKNNHASGDDAIKGQGRGLELEELLKIIRNAADYQKRAQDSKKNQ